MQFNTRHATYVHFVDLHQGIPQAINIFHFVARLKPNAPFFFLFFFSLLLKDLLIYFVYFATAFWLRSSNQWPEKKRGKKRHLFIFTFISQILVYTLAIFPFPMNISIFMFREQIYNTNAETAVMIINESRFFVCCCYSK